MTGESELFAVKVDALTNGIVGLRDSMAEERLARRRTDRRRSVLNVIMLCLLAAVLVAVLKLYDVATTSESARKTGRQTLNGVLDCTTPSPVPPPPAGTPDTRKPADVHVCAERGAAQLAEGIVAITDTNHNGVADIDELAAALGVPLPATTTTTLGANR